MEGQKYYGAGRFFKIALIGGGIGAATQLIPGIGRLVAYAVWIISILYAIGSVMVGNEEIAYKHSYEREISKDKMPSEYYIVLIKSGVFMNNLKYNLWRIQNTLYLFPNNENEVSVKEIENFKLSVLNIDDIEFYTSKGNIYTETVVTGGGVSISGALIGGAIAGAAGAAIGGRKKVDKISSETLTHDDRVIHLYYKVNEQIKIIEIDNSYYKVLLELIPEKEYEYVVTHQSLKA